jgi:two-component system OmpR family sensor kinase
VSNDAGGAPPTGAGLRDDERAGSGPVTAGSYGAGGDHVAGGGHGTGGDLGGHSRRSRRDRRAKGEFRGRIRVSRPLSARFHLSVTYLVIIWITLGVLMAYLSHYLETTAVGSRMVYLYAQAHVLASATQAAGGPKWGVLWEIGGTPARGRVLLIDASGRVVDDSAAAVEFRGRDMRDVSEVKAALAGEQAGNTYYLPGNLFTAYVAVPARWDVGGVGSEVPGGTGDAATGGGYGAVFISQDLSDIVEQYRDIMRAVLIGGAVASVLSLIVAWGLSSVVLGPVLELSAIARRMASGRLDLRVTPKGPRESRDLAESFNYMASGIEKTMEAHEQFLVAAAHELRSPLAAMRAVVESMEIKRPELDELPGFFRDMRGELDRIIHTAEEILDLLRTKELSKEPSADERADAAATVEAVVESRKASVEAKGVSLKFSGQNARVAVSPVILRLVASNLLDNALKFTEAGGAVEVEVAVRGGDLVLSVSDTGIGIPVAEIPRIFERFYRVDRARRRSTGGAGLGLAIVKEAAERSGGTVKVASQVGKGSTFTVTWPGAVVGK